MVPSPKLLTPYDIVFCCSVCQATPTEVYGDLTREGLNLRQGNDTSALLWLTECGHVVCSKHFEGGVPFHLQHEKPRASCPVCETESNNSTTKKLFWLGKDQRLHDDDLPQWLLEGPPAQPRSDETSEVKAWRFGYNKMLRDNTLMRKRLEAFQTAAYTKAVEESGSQEKFSDTAFCAMQKRIEELEVREREYLKYKEKLPAIMHQLGQVPSFVKRIELLQEYIHALGYRMPNKTAATENYEHNDPMTPSGGEPQDRVNQSQYRSNHDATAYPHSGAYLDSGSSGTLFDPAPAHSIARQDDPIVSNSRTRGIKRTRNDYMEDAIQQSMDATTMLHVDERQSMPPPYLPHGGKQATSRRPTAPSQMRNLHEQAQQLPYTYPRQEGSDYYTMSGALRQESWTENGKIGDFNVSRYPRQTKVVSTSWHQQGGLENMSPHQPLRIHNQANGRQVQPSSPKPGYLRNMSSIPIHTSSKTFAHRPETSIVPILQTMRAQSATPGQLFREESQSGRPRTRFRNGVPCMPILSRSELPIYRPTQPGVASPHFRNGVPCVPMLSRAGLAVYPSTESGQAGPRFRNGMPCTPVLSRTELAVSPQAQPLVSRFFSTPATPSTHHSTNSNRNTRGGSLPAKSSTTNEPFRMDPNGGNSAAHRSLNPLSFISNPYTSSKEPIGAQFGSDAAPDSRLPSSVIGSRVNRIDRRSVRR